MQHEPHPLRAYRIKTGLSLEDLANAAKTTKSTLSRIETGGINPSLDLIARLKEATGGAVSADDFLREAKCS